MSKSLPRKPVRVVGGDSGQDQREGIGREPACPGRKNNASARRSDDECEKIGDAIQIMS